MLHIDLGDEENQDLTLNNVSSNSPRLLELCDRFDIRPGSAPRAIFGRSGRVRVMHRLHTHICQVTLIPYDKNLSQQVMIWSYYAGHTKGSAQSGFRRLFESAQAQEARRVERAKAAAARAKKRNGERRKKR